MKITLLGHASIAIETTDCRILMDPVFWDPFCEGLNASCPQREVISEKLPTFDFLVISHKHLDHFDVRTLSGLPRDIDVLVPPDPLIIQTLKTLGYRCIYPLHDFEIVKCGTTTLMTTRSEVRVPEFGLVVADPSGVFWNTVDSYFAPPTIQKVRKTFPTIDFLLATWHISMEAAYQSNRNLAFPHHLYGKLFQLFRLVEPRAIAPGASGWKYINQAAWQNQVVFPVTQERFCYDVKQAFPALADQVFQFDPGDTVTLTEETCIHTSASCDYAFMIKNDRECLDFSPVTAGNPLIDPNPEQYVQQNLEDAITAAVEKSLTEFINQNLQTLFVSHRHWQVIYQLDIIFPEGRYRWAIDFAQGSIQAVTGRDPLANLFTYITATSFFSLINKKKEWDYLWCSGDYRTFQKIYRMTSHGILFPESGEIMDPLQLQYPANFAAGENLNSELARWSNPEVDQQAVPPCAENPMVSLGNLYVKRRIHQPSSP